MHISWQLECVLNNYIIWYVLLRIIHIGSFEMYTILQSVLKRDEGKQGSRRSNGSFFHQRAPSKVLWTLWSAYLPFDAILYF